MCRECGYTVKCKNCNITMTYHLNTNKYKDKIIENLRDEKND